MSFEETADLARSLKELGIPMQRLLINGVIPESAVTKCDFCATRRRSQDEVIASFQRRFGKSMQLLVAPQQDRDVQGEDLLMKHFQGWCCTTGC
jgi:anion-transporting  ArsA/GET3 family ATPase